MTVIDNHLTLEIQGALTGPTVAMGTSYTMIEDNHNLFANDCVFVIPLLYHYS